MAKRRRGKAPDLDIKPQIMTASSGLTAAADDYGVNQINLPVNRLGGGGADTAWVVEILSVDWYLGMEDIGDTSHTTWGFLTTNANRVDAEVSTVGTLADDAVDPLTFAMAVYSNNIATQGGSHVVFPVHIDLSDGAGNGILVAVDRISVVMGNVGGGAAMQAVAKIMYKIVEVGIQEYVGIVQAQQAG